MRVCLLVVAIAMVSCGAPTSPSAPSSGAVATSSAPPSGAPVATLAISSFDVTLLEVSNGRYVYRPMLVLSETGGRSAATLTGIVLSTPGGDSFGVVNVLVGGYTQRVPPGQTWDLSMSPYYPAFADQDSHSEVESVQAVVSFTDDEGRRGSVSSTAIVKR